MTITSKGNMATHCLLGKKSMTLFPEFFVTNERNLASKQAPCFSAISTAVSMNNWE